MTETQRTLRLKIQVPPRERKTLSACAATVPALEAWVAELPLANAAVASRELYRLLQELARLQTDGEQRLRMLEVVRPGVHDLERLLAQRFLNRRVLVSELERRTARLSTALLAALAAGYKVAFVEALRSGDGERLTLALHRAITELAAILLRRCQLYAPPLERLWLDLNQLYAAAEGRGLLDRRVEDACARDGRGPSVRAAWCRAALLWSANPNRLRQKDIATVHEHLEVWAERAVVGGPEGPGAFLLDLGADRGPCHRAFFREPPHEGIRSLDPGPVVEALRAALAEPETPDLPLGSPPPRPELLENLVSSWGTPAERAHERASGTGAVDLCIGLRGLHHQASGGQPFERQLAGECAHLAPQETNPFLGDRRRQRPMRDVWSNAFDVGGARMPENVEIIDPERALFRSLRETPEASPAETAPVHRSAVVDTSPGGFCLRWGETVPCTLQAGELIGLRERPEYDWCAAVVRWLRTDRDGTTRMGVELLAPRVAPAGVRLVQKRGGPTEYVRALLLPRDESTGRPDALLTPQVPFAEGQKVHINQDGEARRAHLRRVLGTTHSYKLFDFRLLEEPRRPAPDDRSARL